MMKPVIAIVTIMVSGILSGHCAYAQSFRDLLDKGKEEVIKQNDHCCDALRYYIMGMWNYLKMLLPYTERGDK